MYVDSRLSSQLSRILFLLRSIDDKTQLLELFRDLPAGRVSRFALWQAGWAEFSTSCPPILLKLVKNERSWQIQYENSDADGKVLVWSRHDEGWLECAEKIAALSGPSHQFMGSGEAEIELSFLEALRKTEI
jgi:hypothetical protein